MKYIGKFGEHVALSRLLAHGLEAYPALDANQEGYDITVVTPRKDVLRLQVKATELQNLSTNNSIGSVDVGYDFLVVVVLVEGSRVDCFVLSRAEAIAQKAGAKTLAVSSIEQGRPRIRAGFTPFLEAWNRLSTC